MKMLIALVVCALVSTNSFSSSTGTSVNDQSQDLTQAITDILSGEDSTYNSNLYRCIKKHKKRCLAYFTTEKCRVVLVKYCKNVPAVTDRFKECVNSNLRRCSAHYSVKKCRVLLTNACSISDDTKWDYKCVRKYANRCAHAMLTKRECMQKLEPICKK
jgi:hypothetical protein